MVYIAEGHLSHADGEVVLLADPLAVAVPIALYPRPGRFVASGGEEQGVDSQGVGDSRGNLSFFLQSCRLHQVPLYRCEYQACAYIVGTDKKHSHPSGMPLFPGPRYGRYDTPDKAGRERRPSEHRYLFCFAVRILTIYARHRLGDTMHDLPQKVRLPLLLYSESSSDTELAP